MFFPLITRFLRQRARYNWSRCESHSSRKRFVQTDRIFYSIFAAVRETARFTGAYRRIRYLPNTRCRPLFRHEHGYHVRPRILSRFAGIPRSVPGCPIDFLPLCSLSLARCRARLESAWRKRIRRTRRGIRLNYSSGGSFVYSGIHYPPPQVTEQLSSAICNPTFAV